MTRKFKALSPLGERVDREGAFISRRGPGGGLFALDSRLSTLNSELCSSSTGTRSKACWTWIA